MIARRILLCTLFLLLAWAGCIVNFAFSIHRYQPLPASSNADGIVVLTGGSGRIEYGLELLSQQRAKALFISGVHSAVARSALLPDASETSRNLLNDNRVTLGHDATNTIGNAQESLNWMRAHGYHSILLVTADYHMPRALTEFTAQLPARTSIIPAPVRTNQESLIHWLIDPETRNLILLEFHKLIAAEIRHRLIEKHRSEQNPQKETV